MLHIHGTFGYLCLLRIAENSVNGQESHAILRTLPGSKVNKNKNCLSILIRSEVYAKVCSFSSIREQIWHFQLFGKNEADYHAFFSSYSLKVLHFQNYSRNNPVVIGDYWFDQNRVLGKISWIWENGFCEWKNRKYNNLQ